METTATQPTTANPEKSIEWGNKLLRGERSAVEAYQKAVEKHGNDPRLAKLNEIQAEHRRSVTDLEEKVLSMGGTPDTDSGAWGTFAKAVQSAANLFGPESAVQSLQEGEKKGLNDYEDALETRELDNEFASLLRDRLMPRVKSHLTEIERLGAKIG